jgi:hypothetical protein
MTTGLFSYSGELIASCPTPEALVPHLVGCTWLLIQYSCSYPPYLEAVTIICNQRTCHAAVTTDPLNMERRKNVYYLSALPLHWLLMPATGLCDSKVNAEMHYFSFLSPWINYIQMRMLISFGYVRVFVFMSLIRLIKILLWGLFDIERDFFYVFIEEWVYYLHLLSYCCSATTVYIVTIHKLSLCLTN